MRDRLTTDKTKIFARENPTLMSITKDELRKLYNEVFDRLQEYEVAEEQGQIIVPPCKVGDKVYYNKAEISETCPAKVIGIYNNYYTPSMPLWITIEYESKLIGRQEEKMGSEVFKLLCHYSREEAEQALKGGTNE